MTGPVLLEGAESARAATTARLARLVRRVPRRVPGVGPVRPAGTARAVTRGPGTSRRREVLRVGAGSLALAAAMTWPVLRTPTRTVPQDLVDPLYFVWQIAWTGHALGADPAGMYTTNAFLGADGNLAYTDTVLGYAPFAAVVNAVVPGLDGALLAYNLLYVLAAALAFAGAYLLARVLGARPAGALVAAAAYAYAPWHLAHARHLNVLSTGGIALALALLAHGHGWSLRADADSAGRPRKPVRPGWIVAGWAVACWQLSLGFALGVPFAWVLMFVLLAAVVTWFRRGRPAVPRGLRAADAAGATAFAVTGLLLALPYLRVVNDFPVAKRTEDMVSLYSPPVRGLFTAPAESWWWGSLQAGWRAAMKAPPEQALLPGLVLTALAVAGLGYSAWAVRHRVVLAAGIAVTAVLALGASAPAGGRWTYLVVFRHLPGWEALRTPGRLVLWITLAMALLAAGAVTRLAQDRSWRYLLLVPAALVLAEGIGVVAQPVVPRSPVALRSLPGPVLVLPTSQQGDYTVMTWSTSGWPVLVNGGSGFEPPVQSRLRRTAAAFPARDAVSELRAEGVGTVVLDRRLAAGTRWAALAADPGGPPGARAADSGVRLRYQGTAVVYDLGAP